MKMVLTRIDESLRNVSTQLLYLFEAALYVAVGILLAGAALTVLLNAFGILWRGLVERSVAGYALQALDQLLLVLVLVEILHTVRISIRSKEIILEPFLVVGLIASVRRVLVIAMQATKLTEARDMADSEAFRRSMIELGVVGFLVLAFVISIYALRLSSKEQELVKE
jgi:uncharacterized membrane protein (DUF373 family)